MRRLLARRLLSHGNGGCGRRPGPGLRTFGRIVARPDASCPSLEILLRAFVTEVREHARSQLFTCQPASGQVRRRLESVRHEFVAYAGLEFDEPTLVKYFGQPPFAAKCQSCLFDALIPDEKADGRVKTQEPTGLARPDRCGRITPPKGSSRCAQTSETDNRIEGHPEPTLQVAQRDISGMLDGIICLEGSSLSRSWSRSAGSVAALTRTPSFVVMTTRQLDREKNPPTSTSNGSEGFAGWVSGVWSAK